MPVLEAANVLNLAMNDVLEDLHDLRGTARTHARQHPELMQVADLLHGAADALKDALDAACAVIRDARKPGPASSAQLDHDDRARESSRFVCNCPEHAPCIHARPIVSVADTGF